MPRIAPLPLLAAVALGLGLGACGSDDPEIPSVSNITSTEQAQFPLTVVRSGGVAGFSDTLSIQKDGSVTARTKQAQVTCTLDKASLAILSDAAADIAPADRPSAPPGRTADAMQVLLGAATGRVNVEDPRVAEAEPVVTQLLEDVTGPKAQRKICT